MKYLGIDYGSKKVGIAISDDNGILAFPKTILENNKELIFNILNFCKEEKIYGIVIGESLTFQGEENPIMKDIKKFREDLEKEIQKNEKTSEIETFFEKEWMSSVESRRFENYEKPKARLKKKKIQKKSDDKAAAIILQRFLDKVI